MLNVKFLKVVLSINEQSSINIIGPYDFRGLFPCANVTMQLEMPGLESVLYGPDNVQYLLDVLHARLISILTSDAKAVSGIPGDLGFVWNEVLQIKNNQGETDHYAIAAWTEKKSLLLSNSSLCLETWLYVRDGVVHFDVTPVYRWHFNSPEPGERYISYDEFRSNYKPIAQLVISMATIKKWECKVAKLLKIIEKNQDKLNKKYKLGPYKAR